MALARFRPERALCCYLVRTPHNTVHACVQRAINEAANLAHQRRVEQQLREQAAQPKRADEVKLDARQQPERVEAALNLSEQDRADIALALGSLRGYSIWVGGAPCGESSPHGLDPEPDRPAPATPPVPDAPRATELAG